jgi:hypothetical protein
MENTKTIELCEFGLAETEKSTFLNYRQIKGYLLFTLSQAYENLGKHRKAANYRKKANKLLAYYTGHNITGK